jgi:hypothetical protein
MGYAEVMKMPIRAFWVFSRNVDRLRAQDSLRNLRIAIAAQNSEAATELSEELVLGIGDVAMPDIREEPLDQAGLDELRNLQ